MTKQGLVNISTFLRETGERVIKHYKEDLTQDMENMKRWFSVDQNDRYFYVMLRECGSYVFRIPDLFIRETPQHLIWTSYNDPVYKSDAAIEAYAVKVEKIWGGNLFGSVKRLSYEQSAEDVRKHAVPCEHVFVRLSDGAELTCGKRCPCAAHPNCPVVSKRDDDIVAIRRFGVPTDAHLYASIVNARERVFRPSRQK